MWIKDYENLYEITPEGKIYRHYKSGNVKPVNPHQNRAGYLIVNLSKNSKTKTYTVHRLVAQHFISNPKSLPVVDHVDEDKTNNRVKNLRWCTGKENTEFYNTKDGRRHHINIARKRKDQLKTYQNTLQEKNKELNEKSKKIQQQEKALLKLQKELDKKEEESVKAREALKEHIEQEVKRTKNYEGYADTTGVKFKSMDDLVAVTGKKVHVNGKEFRSANLAANYIVKKEVEKGQVRKQATISKEIRRYLQGKKKSWKMYGRYLIE